METEVSKNRSRYRKRGGKSVRKHQDTFRAKKNINVVDQYRTSLRARTFEGTDEAVISMNELRVGVAPHTATIVYQRGELDSRLPLYMIFSRQLQQSGLNICGLYRIGLAMLDIQLRSAEDTMKPLSSPEGFEYTHTRTHDGVYHSELLGTGLRPSS
jgi:hypothetical protein